MVTAYIKAIPPNALDIITSSSNDSQTTIVYDQSGNEIARLHGNENRIRVPYSKIPKTLSMPLWQLRMRGFGSIMELTSKE